MTATRGSLALVVCAGLAICIVELSASGPAAVYAIVERVVLEPNESAPQRIQVWGVFAIADGKPGLGYLAPERGYLYFSLPTAEDRQLRSGVRVPSGEVALSEWADLTRIAGTGAAVAFGERGQWTGRIRTPTDPPAQPEKYPIYNGITQLSRMDTVGPDVIAKLREALRVR